MMLLHSVVGTEAEVRSLPMPRRLSLMRKLDTAIRLASTWQSRPSTPWTFGLHASRGSQPPPLVNPRGLLSCTMRRPVLFSYVHESLLWERGRAEQANKKAQNRLATSPHVASRRPDQAAPREQAAPRRAVGAVVSRPIWKPPWQGSVELAAWSPRVACAWQAQRAARLP